jgi:hypothetical protein
MHSLSLIRKSRTSAAARRVSGSGGDSRSTGAGYWRVDGTTLDRLTGLQQHLSSGQPQVAFDRSDALIADLKTDGERVAWYDARAQQFEVLPWRGLGVGQPSERPPDRMRYTSSVSGRRRP